MKIKEGKKYILRDGTVTSKLNYHVGLGMHPFWCLKCGAFTINGKYFNGPKEHRFDIVAKYKKRKK